MFNTVPRTYERVNHALTLGLDVRWRRRAMELAVRGDELVCVDVCTGTGEMAGLLRGAVAPSCTVMGVDFSLAMMRQGAASGERGAVGFVCGDVMRLPLVSGTVDLVTLSFATRNLAVSRQALIAALTELRRVLRPGGRLTILETSQPPNAVVRLLYRLYVRAVVPPLGALLSKAAPPYAYLSRTILKFYGAPELRALLHEAGFAQVEFFPLIAGAVAVHRAGVSSMA